MEIRVTGKRIPEANLNGLFVKGEKGVDQIDLLIKKKYDKVDLSKLNFMLYMRTLKGGFLTSTTLTKTESGEDLRLSWKVTDNFTRIEGMTRIEISGINANGNTVFKAISNFFSIVDNIEMGANLPPKDVISSALEDMQVYLSEAAERVADAQEWSNQSKGHADNALRYRNEAEDFKNQAASSAVSAAQSKNAAESAKTAAEAEKEAARTAANQAAASATAAETAKGLAETSADQANRFAESAKTSAQSALQSAQGAAESESTAAGYLDEAKQQADRAEQEADRSEEAADRAQNISNLEFINPHTLEMEPLQMILDETFGFLFDLIKKLHNLGITWSQIMNKELTWREIQDKGLSWREIGVSGITPENISALRRTLMGFRRN